MEHRLGCDRITSVNRYLFWDTLPGWSGWEVRSMAHPTFALRFDSSPILMELGVKLGLTCPGSRNRAYKEHTWLQNASRISRRSRVHGAFQSAVSNLDVPLCLRDLPRQFYLLWWIIITANPFICRPCSSVCPSVGAKLMTDGWSFPHRSISINTSVMAMDQIWHHVDSTNCSVTQ